MLILWGSLLPLDHSLSRSDPKRTQEERNEKKKKKRDRSFSANERVSSPPYPARAQKKERIFFKIIELDHKEELFPKLRTSTDCKSPSVSFTGPVTSAAEIALI